MQDRAAPPDDQLVLAHDRLLKDSALQFDRKGFVTPDPPGWLSWIGDLLEALAPVLILVFWLGLALTAVLILYAIAREILRLRSPRAKPEKPAVIGETEWRPDPGTARDLLTEADALAARGLHAEAVHLLLLHSVCDIEKRQPRVLRGSLTTREIAALRILPDAARPAFAMIGRVVERSLFGGAPVGSEDFAECRRAYEVFALPEGWRA